jgi:hypothetical protein
MVYFCIVLSFYKHIESLLIRHDYVVIPGLGGFALQDGHASIQENKILPPSQIICFNPLMKHSDGMLAIEISRKENISYRKAVELIEEELKSFQLELNNAKIASFGSFGSFYKSETGNLIFDPVSFAEFLPANTGLFPEHVPASSKKEVVTVRFERRRLINYAAAIALILGLLFVSPHLNDVRYQHSAGLIPPTFSHTFSVDSVRLKTDTLVTDKCPELQKDTFEQKVIVTNDSELYHVIVACLETEKKAEKYCDELKKSGYECAHVLKPEKTYRISIQSFKDKNEAIGYMENLRRTDARFETSWVLCK